MEANIDNTTIYSSRYETNKTNIPTSHLKKKSHERISNAAKVGFGFLVAGLITTGAGIASTVSTFYAAPISLPIGLGIIGAGLVFFGVGVVILAVDCLRKSRAAKSSLSNLDITKKLETPAENKKAEM